MTKQEHNNKTNSGEYKKKYNAMAYQHKVHMKFYPSPQQSIYAILDKDGNVIRIGSSNRTALRLASHLMYKTTSFAKKDLKVGMSWTIIEDATGLNETELLILEQHYLDLFKPKFNYMRAISDKKAQAYMESLDTEGDV